MKIEDIEVGRTYLGDHGTQARVVRIGNGYVTHNCPPSSTEEKSVMIQHFAAWAKRDVTKPKGENE